MKSLLLFLNPRSRLFRSELEYWLTVSILFSVSLVMAVTVFSGTPVLGFLLWNLFLALIPYFISRWMLQSRECNNNRMIFFLCFLVWLLFVPNSFYIITDLFHLGSFSNIPLWYELAVILSFAWNGLLLGILSIRHIEKLFVAIFPRSERLLFIYPVMFLNSFGVYIGRYMRFNSWDVITNPFHLVKDIANLALHPLEYKYAWGMIVCFSIFMTLMFFTLIHANRGADER